MIVITGDSWAKGEGFYDGKEFAINHRGLEQYLLESGQDVVNLARSGSSNSASLQRIYAWINRHADRVIDHIIFFNTDYARDWDLRHPGDQDRITHADSLAGILIARLYSALSTLSSQMNCSVYLIGACGDCLWLDDMQQQYPGVEVVCQSMTNLLINGEARIEQPVLSWYTKGSQDMIENIRKRVDDAELDRLMQMLDLGMERESLLLDHPRLFWPDGVHPNRQGHLVLYEYLLAHGCFMPNASRTDIDHGPI